MIARASHGKVIVVDEGLCSGCMLCTVACSIAHTGTVSFDRAHIKVVRVAEERYAPLTCHHCETPSCVAACPTGACHRDEASAWVLIDPQRCIGCRSCVMACPFGHAHYDEVARISVKCDYCDGQSECVRVCEPRAIRYVESDEVCGHKRRTTAAVQAAVRLRAKGDVRR